MLLLLACSFGVAIFFGVGDIYAAPVGSWADYADGSWYDAGDVRYSDYGVHEPGSSEEYPYLIRNGAELAYLGEFDWSGDDYGVMDGKFIKLQSDSGVIDLSAHEWAPVELVSAHLNGKEVSIVGMEMVDEWRGGAMGLFAYVHDSVLDDITLTGAKIGVTRPVGDVAACESGDYEACYGENYVGGIAGIAMWTLIRNGAVIDLTLDIAPELQGDGDAFMDSIAIGGMVGRFEYSMIGGMSYVKGGSLNYAPRDVRNSSYYEVHERIGGMVGDNESSTILNACSDMEIIVDFRNDPDYSQFENRTYVGGLVGYTQTTIVFCILNSCAQSDIAVIFAVEGDNGNSMASVGGIAGAVVDDDVINNYYDGDINVANSGGFGGELSVGELFGVVDLNYSGLLFGNYFAPGGDWDAVGALPNGFVLDDAAVAGFGSYEELIGWLNDGRQVVADFALNYGLDGVDSTTIMEWVMVEGELACGRAGTTGFSRGVADDEVMVPDTGVVGIGGGGVVISLALLVGGGAVAVVGFGLNRWRLVRKSQVRRLGS